VQTSADLALRKAWGVTLNVLALRDRRSSLNLTAD
jgi:hypothetical protein